MYSSSGIKLVFMKLGNQLGLLKFASNDALKVSQNSAKNSELLEKALNINNVAILYFDAMLAITTELSQLPENIDNIEKVSSYNKYYQYYGDKLKQLYNELSELSLQIDFSSFEKLQERIVLQLDIVRNNEHYEKEYNIFKETLIYN
jgi:hypothetical protein